LVAVSPSIPAGERIVSAVVAFFAVLAVATVSARYAPEGAAPAMVASMGASVVLLFAVPHSPMAQPWALVGGHLVSAAAGIACYQWVPNGYLAAALAVSFAIAGMHLLRCLHPPGGGTALAGVIGGVTVHDAGFGFLLVPLGLNVATILVAALVLNNLIRGRHYPLVPMTTAPAEGTFAGFGISRADLELGLREMDGYIDVAESDLDEIVTRALRHSFSRRFGELRCRDVMERDAGTAEFGTELAEVWEGMRREYTRGVAVLDRARRVIGVVTIADFLMHAGVRGGDSVFARLTELLRRSPGVGSDKAEVVGQIMSAPAITVGEDTPVSSLLALFAQHRIRHVPIVDQDERYVGMVTQFGLVAALNCNAAMT
jgi:CBS domain-containing membrane protein